MQSKCRQSNWWILPLPSLSAFLSSVRLQNYCAGKQIQVSNPEYKVLAILATAKESNCLWILGEPKAIRFTKKETVRNKFSIKKPNTNTIPIILVHQDWETTIKVLQAPLKGTVACCLQGDREEEVDVFQLCSSKKMIMVHSRAAGSELARDASRPHFQHPGLCYAMVSIANSIPVCVMCEVPSSWSDL